VKISENGRAAGWVAVSESYDPFSTFCPSGVKRVENGALLYFYADCRWCFCFLVMSCE
jgi:hypothetical protein